MGHITAGYLVRRANRTVAIAVFEDDSDHTALETGALLDVKADHSDARKSVSEGFGGNG